MVKHLAVRIYIIVSALFISAALTISPPLTPTSDQLEFGNCGPFANSLLGISGSFSSTGMVALQLKQDYLVRTGDTVAPPSIQVGGVRPICRSHGTKRGLFSSVGLAVSFWCRGVACESQGTATLHIFYFKCNTDNQWGLYTEPGLNVANHSPVTKSLFSYPSFAGHKCSVCYNVQAPTEVPFVGIKNVTHSCQCELKIL